MIARKQEIRLQFSQFIDALLLGGVFWLAHFLRSNHLIILDSLVSIEGFEKFFWMQVIIMPFGPILLEMQGFYIHPLEKTAWKSLRQIMSAAFWLFFLLGLAVIFLRLDVPSRSVLILFAFFAPLALLGREKVMKWIYLRRLHHGWLGERIIMAGEQEVMSKIQTSFTPVQRLEIRVVEEVNLEQQDVDALVDALHRHAVGRVILGFHRTQVEKVQQAIEVCEIEGVEAWLNADFIHTSVTRPTYEVLAHHPMLVFRASPEWSWAMIFKNVMDRVGAGIGLLLLTPLLLVVGLVIKCTSPGPIFFRQRRAGLHGYPFEMWKFRTMCVDAEARQAELESLNVMEGPVFKVDDDPRVTPIGRWLRRTSIDELPQLWNVLCGEMSLVGPRPLPLYELAKFARTEYRRRMSMKPGLTCLWQIRGRNIVTNFRDWVNMDLEYIDNWSILLDIYILIRTIPVVLFGIGAK